MNDSSDEDFDGFNNDEIGVAAQRYNQRLIRQGIMIGDIIVTDESENENDSDEDTPVDPVMAMDPSGDHLPGDWHDGFRYAERGLPHLFLPRGNTGPTNILGPEKEPADFLDLFVSDEVLNFIIQETERYVLKQFRDHPDENKLPWTPLTVDELKAFLGLCFLMGINIKPYIIV